MKNKKTQHLALCLLDLLDDGEESDIDESEDWIQLIDRGGLTNVNDVTYHLFVAMELEIRKHLQSQSPQDVRFKDKMTDNILKNDDVLFYWSMLSADWSEGNAEVLIHIVIELWITIRGFSYASAWMEKYKASQKKTVQKSKGVRKQLISKPSASAQNS